MRAVKGQKWIEQVICLNGSGKRPEMDRRAGNLSKWELKKDRNRKKSKSICPNVSHKRTDIEG